MLTEDQAFVFVICLMVLVGVMTVWRQGWVGLYQITIFISIVFADIYWEWDSEGMAIYAVAAIAAYLLTVIPIKIYDWSIRFRRWLRDRSRARSRIAGSPQEWDSIE